MAHTALDTIIIPEFIKRLPWDFVYFNDFCDGPLTGVTSHLAADSGATVTNAGVHGGAALLTTGATDNNEAAIGTQSCVNFLANKPWYAQGRVTLTEANTDDANLFFGASSVLTTANLMVDDGAGPATSMTAAGFYKTDSATVNNWRTITSKSTTQTLQLTDTAVATGVPITFGIHCFAVDSANAYVNFLLDPLGGAALVPARLSGSNARLPDASTTQNSVVIASAVAMKVGMYVKAGGANSEVPQLDYLYVCGRR